MLKKVISGGQIGADIAALRAARAIGLETGGHATKGWRTLEGSNPELADYGLVEHTSSNYPPRTFANVKNSDATLRLAANFNSAGERCTMKAILKYNKPSADVQIYEGYQILADPLEVVQWLQELNVTVLNVAGNGIEEIEQPVESFLKEVFYYEKKSLVLPVPKLPQSNPDT